MIESRIAQVTRQIADAIRVTVEAEEKDHEAILNVAVAGVNQVLGSRIASLEGQLVVARETLEFYGKPGNRLGVAACEALAKIDEIARAEDGTEQDESGFSQRVLQRLAVREAELRGTDPEGYKRYVARLEKLLQAFQA